MLSGSMDVLLVPDDFPSIQEAVDHADEGDIIYVRSGVYHEHIVINRDNLKLIGEDKASTIIDGDGIGKVVYIIADNITLTGFTMQNSGDNWDDSGVYLEKSYNINITDNIITNNEIGVFIRLSSNTSITNNIIFDNDALGIYLQNSLNNSIAGNYIENVWPIMLSRSYGNHIKSNKVYSRHPSGISLYDRSDNNVIENNVIYGVEGDEPCTAIRSIWCLNNLYENNTIKRSRWGIYLGYSNGSIILNNNIMEAYDGPAIGLYHADNNIVANNNITSSKFGITLCGFSKNNLMQGNKISRTDRGISLYYWSDSNKIINNNVSFNSIGIILDTVTGNLVYKNNFRGNAKQGYDYGGNKWSFMGEGNYWDDYDGVDVNDDGIGDTPNYIYPRGVDYSPLTVEVEIKPIEAPQLQIVSIAEPPPHPTLLTRKIEWKDQVVKLENSIGISNGGYLLLKNVTLIVSYDSWEPFFIVENGGTLLIHNSTIFANGRPIWVEEGGVFQMEDSKLYSGGNWEGGGAIRIFADKVVIENNIIEDSFGIHIERSSKHRIENNEIRYCYLGILGLLIKDLIIANNTIHNIIYKGMSFNGIINSTITGNTVQHIWGSPIHLEPYSLNINSYGNIIYNNNFIDYLEKPLDSGSENSWDYMGKGNYWYDYDGKDENKDGIGDTPHPIHPNGVDRHPLITPTGIPQASLKIHCIDGDNEKLHKANLELRDFLGHLININTTNVNGWVNFSNLTPGNYVIIAYWRNVRVASHYVNLISNTIIDPLGCDVYDCYIQVLDPDGESIKKANVTLNLWNGAHLTSALTNTTGWVKFNQLPSAMYSLNITYPGIKVKNMFFTLSTEEQIETIYLPIYDWNIKLLDGDFEALPNARVEIYSLNGSLLRKLKTNNEGLIRILNLPPKSYSLKIYWMGIEILNTNLTLSHEEQKDNITCPVYDLLVHIINEEGKDLSNARITLYWYNETMITHKSTNMTGHVAFEELPKGVYKIEVVLEGYRKQIIRVNLTSENQVEEVTLQSTAFIETLTGKVITISVIIIGITIILLYVIKKRQ